MACSFLVFIRAAIQLDNGVKYFRHQFVKNIIEYYPFPSRSKSDTCVFPCYVSFFVSPSISNEKLEKLEERKSGWKKRGKTKYWCFIDKDKVKILFCNIRAKQLVLHKTWSVYSFIFFLRRLLRIYKRQLQHSLKHLQLISMSNVFLSLSLSISPIFERGEKRTFNSAKIISWRCSLWLASVCVCVCVILIWYLEQKFSIQLRIWLHHKRACGALDLYACI